jgi:hypothetical protein
VLYLALVAILSSASVQGTVRSEGTRAPVRNAEARLVSLDRSARTDLLGRFAFADVPAGQWLLTVTAPGFSAYQAIVRVSENGVARLDIELAATLNPLPKVEVRAPAVADGGARAARELFNAEPIPSVASVSSREMRALPAVIEPDVLRSLQTLPGVVPLNDFDAQLYVHGGSADQNLILLDGARVFSPYHMFGMTSAFNADAVDAATFFRGSLPARYGGALSSVVAIEQRDGVPRDSIRAGLSILGARAATGGTLFDDRARWMIAGRRSHADLFFGNSIPYAFRDLQARLSFQQSPTRKISASLFHSADRFRMFFAGGDDASLTSHWGNTAGSIRWQSGGDSASTIATLWGSRYDAAMTAGDELAGPRTRNDIHAGGIRVEKHWMWDRSSLRIGAELEAARIVLDGPALAGSYFSGHVSPTYVAPALYVEGDRWLGFLRVLPALRLTRDLRTGALLAEPRLATRVQLRDSITVTVAATRGFQSVSMLRDERTLLPGASFWFVHPDGAPTSRSDGLAVELDLPLFDAWSLRAEAYRRRFTGLPHWRPEGTRDLASISYDAGTSNGAEISVRRHGERLSGWLGYGVGRTRLTQAATGETYFPSWDRRQALTATLMAQPKPRLFLSARVDYGSGQPFWPFAGQIGTPRLNPLVGGTDVTELTTFWAGRQLRYPQYFRADLGVRTVFRVWSGIIEPYLTLQNITARPNVIYYKLDIDPADFYAGTNPTVVPMLQPVTMPRSFIPSIGFNVRF